MKKILLVTLGCSKNTVDSEQILSFFIRNNFEVTLNPNDADLILINTCGFIGDAKKESIDTIFKYSKYKNAKLVVTGCLVERYLKELEEEIPEVDLFIPLRNYSKMASMVRSLFKDEIINEYNPYYRVLSTPSFSSYLKISDGCSHHCSYCAIPLIRGEFHSFKKEDILNEAKRLGELGIKELVIISQDTTRYGEDLYNDYNIVNLLQDILDLNYFKSIRLLYLYAYEVSDELIKLYKNNQKVLLPYFDIPIQHSSDNVLKKMNRKDKKEDIISLFNKIKKEIPNAILRTTLIVGFPGETNEDFNDLKEFINLYKFDHLGVFKYSKEEGTAGFNMKNQISEDVKQERLDLLMKDQSKISYELNKKHLNEEMFGFITEKLSNNEYLIRTYFNAPDDIDGNIYLKTDKSLKIGDIVNIRIIDTGIYDLEAELI